MANKIKFKLKFEKFELEMEGTREDTAAVTSQFGNAFQGLIKPPSVDGQSNEKPIRTEDAEATVVSLSADGSPKKKLSRRPRQNGGPKSEAKPIDFKNEPEKYGTPSMKWSTSTKSLWMLYVAKSSLNIDGLTSHQIADTFNNHFRAAKMIKSFTVTRDLGKLKIDGTNSYVGEDKTKDPNVWYITEAGEKHIQKLISEQKAQGNGVG